MRQRKSPRLAGYNYTLPGAYFVTINTKNSEILFGKVFKAEMMANHYGQMAYECWLKIIEHYPTVTSDIFIAMPNHIHGVLFIAEAIDAKQITLGSVIGSYKGAVTRQMRAVGFEGEVWHGRFYDHIIRKQEDLERIRAYVMDNPRRWWEKYGESIPKE